MSPDPANSTNEIPDSLRTQLESFRQVLWRRKMMESVAAGAIGLLVSFLLIFGLDRIWQTPSWCRFIILISGVSFFAGFAPYWLHRWIWRHRHEGQLAKLIAKKFPGLGDRLLGVIELQAQLENDDSLSPRLRAAAMEVVSSEVSKRDLNLALPTPRHRKWSLAAMVLSACAALAFVVAPKAGINSVERWLKPFSDIERYTFTQLEDSVDHLVVPYGEAFEITLKLAPASEQKPTRGSAQYGLQPEIQAQLNRDHYIFRFPGQQEKGTVIFKIGDLVHRIKVEPMQRPSVTGMKVYVSSPKYLQLPDRETDLSVGEVSAVEGSTLKFRFEMTRPLKSGSYGPPIEIERDRESAPATAADKSSQGPLVLDRLSAETAPIEIGQSSYELPFSWADEHGLSNASNFKLRVNAVKDNPPVAYTQGLERQKAILPEEVLDFEILCEDDFGLKRVGIEWETLDPGSGKPTGEKNELLLPGGGPEITRIMEQASFSPEAFGLGPQKLVLRAFSEDFFPQRSRVYSEPIVVYVLTREEHSQILKSKFDRAISELEDLSRKELNLLDENQRLERLDAGDLQADENQKRLDVQEQAESENTQRMKDLTERMEDIMKGATRNGEIDKETLKKMAEALKSMQELSDADMPEVRDKLREAQELSNTPEKSKDDVEDAVEAQKKVVEKIKKALEQANDANKRFEASTFVSRLKKAASEQNSIAGVLIASFPNIIGLRESQIDPADQRKLTDTTRQQVQTASDIRWIQEDLGHYHARTGDKVFKGILDQMQETKIDLGLEDIRVKLQKNHSYTATEKAKYWAEKLSGWAAILADEMNKNNGSGGGGGSAADPEDEDFEFMLRVMKMIQKQQDVRARTRVLEQLKRDARNSAQLTK
ncbi:hypothetical protein ACFSSA_15645 [Luteolibacter algae]|uniref:Uncharacterized protein n=1 Tax=Luteolibacter algae TaxID=454151 RepID=A0ABW5DC32_9BACT